jgi:hypothetical protein
VDADSNPPEAGPKPAPKPSRLKALLEEYGTMALVIYFAIFALVLAGFAIAIAAGVQVKSAAGGAGVLGAAWVATKLTQPLRILATLALVPIVARIKRRRSG